VQKLAETGLVRLVYGGVASPEKNDQKTKDFSVVITDKGISAEYAQDIRAQGPVLLIVETE